MEGKRPVSGSQRISGEQGFGILEFSGISLLEQDVLLPGQISVRGKTQGIGLSSQGGGK